LASAVSNKGSSYEMTPLSECGEQIPGEVFSSASQNAELRLENKHFH